MSGQHTHNKSNAGHKVSGCDNVISFADFAASMEKKGRAFSRTQPMEMRAAASSVIYIGDLR